jgi:hypothetical protein
VKARLVRWGGAAALILLVIVVRVLWSARSELAQGERSLDRHDEEGAIAHFRRAAHWYAPGNPWSTAALDRLKFVGRHAEMQGDLSTALRAYRAIRTSILGTRSFYTPHPARLASANRRIARLMAKLPRPPEDVGKPYSRLVAEHLALLERDDAPKASWSFVMLLGFATWITAAFRMVGRGLDAEGRIQTRPFLAWAGVLVVGLGVWMLGLLLA